MHLGLTGSVGIGGKNLEEDVIIVQSVLTDVAEALFDPRMNPGPVDGICEEGTESAIERFQMRFMFLPDGRIDPKGTTAKRLNAILYIQRESMVFPLAGPADMPYNSGMRAFGARRSDGRRAHAANDLYGPLGEPVYAMSYGKVIDVAGFYGETDAVTVDHGSYIARYGEIYPDVKVGDVVAQGAQVGRIGQLYLKDAKGRRYKFKYTMLHFEMYDKTATGDLTRHSRAQSAYHIPTGRCFYRRKDLIEPYPFLRKAPYSRER